MADMLKTGSDWLAGKFKSFASQSVVYSRGANSVTVSATMSFVREEILDEQDSVIRLRFWDFLIQADDIKLNSLVEEPKRGDQIRWTNGTTKHVFDVFPVDGNAWNWSDSYHKVRRIHTQETKSETV